MTNSHLWVIFSILIVILILAVFFLFRGKKKGPVDFYNFFVLGIIWIPIGIALENYTFSLLGLILCVIGFVNKDKWETNKITFKNLDKRDKKIVFLILIISFVLIFFVFFTFFFYGGNEKVIGGDKDNHGCLIGAGYSYCPSTEKCQRMWEEYCEDFKEIFRVDSFEDCVLVGNPVMESYPRQCRNGNETFVEKIN